MQVTRWRWGTHGGPLAAGPVEALLAEILRWTEDELWRGQAPDNLAPATRRAVTSAVAEGRKLRFLLPAFPAKSSNPRKTSGDAPDLGDITALFRLEDLCVRVRRLHAPGAEVVLCSDGRVFADVVGVTDGAVSLYRDGIARAIDGYALGSLRLFCLEDAYGSDQPDSLREAIVRDFAVSSDALAREIAGSDARRAMFNGIHRFLFEDTVARATFPSRTAAREAAKPFAYETVRRSDAWSRLVAKRFPEAVRLSIHPQAPGSEKIPVRLLPADERWATPWHRSAFWDGRRLTLERRENLERMGATLRTTPEGWTYWQSGETATAPPAPCELAREAFR